MLRRERQYTCFQLALVSKWRAGPLHHKEALQAVELSANPLH